MDDTSADTDESPRAGGKWTMRQRMFVAEYMIDYNQSAAAVRAGYSEKHAKDIAHKLMQQPHIKKAVKQAVADRLARLKHSADAVVAQMGNIAFADLRELSPELMAGISPETAAAIQSVKLSKRQSGEYDEDGKPIYEDLVEYRIADRTAALNMLGKVHKLLSEKVDHAGKVEHTHTTKVVEIPAKSPLPDDDGNPVEPEPDATAEE